MSQTFNAFLICVALALIAEVWIRNLRPQANASSETRANLPRAKHSARLLSYYALTAGFAVAVLFIACPGLRAWYVTAPTRTDRTVALAALAGVAVTAWTGGLIAFSITKRLGGKLSFGLRLLTFAAAAPLLALLVNVAILRTVALPIVVVYAVLAVIAFKVDARFAKGKIDVNWKPSEGEVVSPIAVAEKINAAKDFIARHLKAGPHLLVIATLSFAVFVRPSEAVVGFSALVWLLLGLRLCVQSLVGPFTLPGDNWAVPATSDVSPNQSEQPSASPS